MLATSRMTLRRSRLEIFCQAGCISLEVLMGCWVVPSRYVVRHCSERMGENMRQAQRSSRASKPRA